MAIEMRQQMKLSQQLVMTPQLQQAIKLSSAYDLDCRMMVQELKKIHLLNEIPEAEESKEVEQLELSEKRPGPKNMSQIPEVTTDEEFRGNELKKLSGWFIIHCQQTTLYNKKKSLPLKIFPDQEEHTGF